MALLRDLVRDDGTFCGDLGVASASAGGGRRGDGGRTSAHRARGVAHRAARRGRTRVMARAARGVGARAGGRGAVRAGDRAVWRPHGGVSVAGAPGGLARLGGDAARSRCRFVWPHCGAPRRWKPVASRRPVRARDLFRTAASIVSAGPDVCREPSWRRLAAAEDPLPLAEVLARIAAGQMAPLPELDHDAALRELALLYERSTRATWSRRPTVTGPCSPTVRRTPFRCRGCGTA
jgi:hypothetical protein